MKRIALLTNIIPPYRLPLFNGIGEQVELDVLVCTDNEKNRSWHVNDQYKFNVKKLHGITLSLRNDLNDYRFIYMKFSILFYLIKNRPHKLVIGDASLTSYFAALCCKALKINYIWWNETLPFTPIKQGLLGKLRRFSIKNAMHHFVSGTLAKEFILNYGIEEKKITVIPDAVDNEKYIEYYSKLKPIRNEIRIRYGITKDDFTMLYVGQFIDRKNIQLMLDTYRELYKSDKNIKFILVGGGELERKIKQYKEEHNLDGLIILDFLESDKLAELYTIADVLLLISKSEPWGMVVNEAMCFGVPVVVSKFVGAGADLVNIRTGFIVKELQIMNLVNAMFQLKSSDFDKLTITEKVNSWSNERAINNAIKNL